MSILVINAGSTSLKFGLFSAPDLQPGLSGSLDWADGDRDHALFTARAPGEAPVRRQVAVPDDPAAACCLIEAVRAWGTIELVGHRVVHGGAGFGTAAMLDERVKQAIEALSDVAPLHNPPALAAARACEALLPGVPQAAVFDTAFFAGLPERARAYPLPWQWQEEWGLKRIGFHGLSNHYCAERAEAMVGPRAGGLRLVTLHLGGGCSATACRGGRPVATTMGFTPLEGLPMGTRCGSVDPGLLLLVQRRHGLSLDDLDHALNHESGLLGLSGVSSDLARIEEAAGAGNARAQLAFDVFADRVRSAVGGLAVTLGGLDALVFTDRIGEGSPALRAAVCDGLECLGARLDPARNAAMKPDADLAAEGSGARVLAIATREEYMIAREALKAAGRV